MTTPPVYYASAIVVKAVTDPDGPAFRLDLGIAGGWFSTEPVSRGVVDAIRAAASTPAELPPFEAVHVDDGSPLRFIVDRTTVIENEWSYP